MHPEHITKRESLTKALCAALKSAADFQMNVTNPQVSAQQLGPAPVEKEVMDFARETCWKQD